MKKLLAIVVLGFLFSSIGNAKELVLKCKPSKSRFFDIKKNIWITGKGSDEIYKIDYKKKKVYRMVINRFLEVGSEYKWGKDSIQWGNVFSFDDTKETGIFNRYTGELITNHIYGPESSTRRDDDISKLDMNFYCSRIDKKF